MSWSRKFNRCLECNTSIYPHKSGGFCSRCYRANKEIEKLNNSDDIEHFKYKYLGVHGIQAISGRPIANQKQAIRKAIRAKRLYYLKLYGQIESGQLSIEILRLEEIMNEIARRLTNKTRFYTNDLMFFATRFSEPQRKIVALKLLKMLVKTRH
jgi:hypothetical protein